MTHQPRASLISPYNYFQQPPFDGPGQITALLAASLMFEFPCVLAHQSRE